MGLILVWGSCFCYLASVCWFNGPTVLLVEKKNLTDVYFILIKSSIDWMYG